jgi:hypothetical protein
MYDQVRSVTVGSDLVWVVITMSKPARRGFSRNSGSAPAPRTNGVRPEPDPIPAQDPLMIRLRELYDAVAEEPIPDSMLALLRKLQA